jgi:exosortase/archaeosortase family protein
MVAQTGSGGVRLVMPLAWVDRLPAWLWLALPTTALLPVWRWCAARLVDGSDDPLGIVALAALAVLVVRDCKQFSGSPRQSWMVVTMSLVAAAVLGAAALPALVRGVLGVLAVCAALMASRRRGQPMLAIAGLGLLALPLLSSLQFFVGFPLRVVTAEASSLLLSAFGVVVERSGSALTVAGRLVMVDAPCSGIQMGWMAYFTACFSAAWLRIPDLRFLRRVPFVGVTVLGGNIVRNTLLVVKEAGVVSWPHWTHEAIGLATFAGVCALVLWHVAGAGRAPARSDEGVPHKMVTCTFLRWVRALSLAAYAGLAIWPWLQPGTAVANLNAPAVEWPQQLEGRPLQPLALSVVEQRFADRFPGAIGRFTDGASVIVLRHVVAPTRMLHPATDCYRGLGYRISGEALEHGLNDQSRSAPTLRRCFIAERDGQRVRVCEHIVDTSGQRFTDTSAWYWSAVTGRSQGPWQAVTKATPL